MPWRWTEYGFIGRIWTKLEEYGFMVRVKTAYVQTVSPGWSSEPGVFLFCGGIQFGMGGIEAIGGDFRPDGGMPEKCWRNAGEMPERCRRDGREMVLPDGEEHDKQLSY